MEKKLVSILIVSYNAEKYIKKTIKSCLYQTYNNIEVLLLDNNSQDKTVEIIKKMEQQSSQLKIFQSEKNLGPYGGLNFLLEKARGEYIAIQDHDDIWFPEKIEKQVKFLERNKDFIACGTGTFYFYEKEKKFILDRHRKFTDFVDHTSLVFRNKGFRYNTNYLLADEYFEKKILEKDVPIFCLSEALNIHRIRNDKKNYSLHRFQFNLKTIKDFFEINGFRIGSFVYLSGIFVTKYFPNKITWLIIKIIKMKSLKINNVEFSKKYPQIDF